MQNQNTNNLSPWDEDLPEETPQAPAPQVGTLHAGPVTPPPAAASGAFTVPASAPAPAQPAAPVPAAAPLANIPAQSAPATQPLITPVAPVTKAPAVPFTAPSVAQPVPGTSPAPAPVVPAPAVPAPANTVTSKFAAPFTPLAAATDASFDDSMPNKFAPPKPATLNTAPVAISTAPKATAVKPKMSLKMKAIIFGSLAFILILFGLGVVLTENGTISIGFENVYGSMGLEKLWGGLSKDTSSSLGKSFAAMSNQPSFKMTGKLSMTADSSVESKYTSPLVSMSDNSYALADVDLTGSIIKALLTVQCIGCDPSYAATVDLSNTAVNSTITRGNSVSLIWSTTNAVSCSADWTGKKGTSGSETLSPTATKTYSMTCKNSVGDATTATTTVTVNDAPAAPTKPTATLTANDASTLSIQTGDSFTIKWASTDSTSCSSSWGGDKGISGSESIKPASAGTITYTMTCSGAGGTSSQASAVVTVTDKAVAPAATTAAISADKTSIAYGGSVKLTWSSNGTACASSWGGNKAASGTQTLTGLTVNKTYTVTCSGAGGSKAASVAITVGAKPAVVAAPTVTLSADKTSVAYNGSVVLTWNSTNATKCATSWTKLVTTSGTATLSSLTSTANYTMTCTGAGGSKTSNVVAVTVAAAAAPIVAPTKPTVTLTSDKTTAGYYDNVVLTWSSTDADTCAASWTLLTTTSGTETVTTYGSDTTYTISCTGKGGSTTSNEVTVAFNEPVVTPIQPLVRLQKISADVTGTSSDNGLDVNLSVTNETATDPTAAKSSVELMNVGSKVWVKSDTLKFDQAAVSGIWLEYNISALKDTTLAKIMFAKDATSRPTVTGKRLGNEKINNVRCFHYSIDSLLIGNSLSSIGIKSDATQKVSGDVWIGISDKLIRKISLKIGTPPSSSATDLAVTLNFTDFGKKNTISAPSVSDVISATGEMFSASGSTVTSGSAVSGSTVTSGSATTGTTAATGTAVTTGSTTTGTTAVTGSTASTGTTVVPQTSVQINDAQRKIDLASIKAALEDYKSIGGKYPVSASYVSLNTATNVVAKALVPKHLAALPLDPKSADGWYYAYKSTNGTTFTLSTKLENLVDPALTTVNGTSFYLLQSTQ